MTYSLESHSELDPECVVVVPAEFNRSHMTRVLQPGQLAHLLRRFDPDHIHIEEDPHSCVSVETILLARLVARQATVSFFIWDNMAKQLRFPLNVAKAALRRFSFG